MDALIDARGVAGISAAAGDAEGSANHLPNRNLPLTQLAMDNKNGCSEEAEHQRETVDIVNSAKGVSNNTISSLISNSSLSCLDGVDEDTAVMLRFLLRSISQVCGGGVDGVSHCILMLVAVEKLI